MIKKSIKFFLFCIAWSASLFRRKKMPRKIERIFILASGYLGDTFWAIQTLPLLKQKYPDTEFYIGGKPFIRELCHMLIPQENQRIIRSVISDRQREKVSFLNIFAESKVIRKQLKPDLLIDLVCNRYSALFAFRTGAYTVGIDCADEFYPLYSFCAKQKQISGVHLAGRPISIVKQFLGLKETEKLNLTPPVPRYCKTELSEKFSIRDDDKLIMLIPGAGWETKRWDKTHFNTLGKFLTEHGYRIVISGSASEETLCNEISQGIKNSIILCNGLAETISLLPHCKAAVGNDSGVSHLAASYGIKVFILYCQTNPEFCGALGVDAHYFRTECPYSPRKGEHFCQSIPTLNCMRSERMAIASETIAKELLEQLNENA